MVHIIDHPLIKHKLTIMRKKETCSKDFRENLDEIASLMAYEVTKNVSLREINITTPICDTIGYEVKDNILIVPILRAGLGLVDGFKKVIPTAAIGHIGLARDEETFKPFEYLCKLPTIHEDTKQIAEWYKFKENLDIVTYAIDEFVNTIKEENTIGSMLKE